MIEAKNKVESAIDKSMPDIQKLLHLNVHELTISCLISKHLAFSTGEISVNAEYDKHYDKAKTMSLEKYVMKYRNNTNNGEEFNCSCRDCKKIKSDKKFVDTKRSKRPDIIIHKMNSDSKNHIVIEIKKTKKCLWDYLRLKYMTSPEGAYRYSLGIFIYFPQGKPEYVYFVNGEEKF